MAPHFVCTHDVNFWNRKDDKRVVVRHYFSRVCGNLEESCHIIKIANRMEEIMMKIMNRMDAHLNHNTKYSREVRAEEDTIDAKNQRRECTNLLQPTDF